MIIENTNKQKKESAFLLEGMQEANKNNIKKENNSFNYTILYENNVYKIKNQDNQEIKLNIKVNPDLIKYLDNFLINFDSLKSNPDKQVFIYLTIDDEKNIISSEIQIGLKGKRENLDLTDEQKKQLNQILHCFKVKFDSTNCFNADDVNNSIPKELPTIKSSQSTYVR